VNGFFNATPVLVVPVFYSWPHFYLGDQNLSLMLDGVRGPEEDLDSSWIDVQPIIGANCQSSRKIQGNLVVGDVNDTEYTNITMPLDIYFPTYWMDIKSAITDDQATEMRNALAFYDTAKVGSKAILYACSIISPVLFFLAVWILWRRQSYWRKDGDGQLLSFGDEAEPGGIPIGYGKTNAYGGTSH